MTGEGSPKPKKWTDFTIKALRPSAGRTEHRVPDDVVVGRKSFAVRFRANGKPKKLTLPPGTTLAEARSKAATAVFMAQRGEDPTAAKRMAKEAQRAAAANTFKAVAEAYLEREGKKREDERLRSLAWRRQLLERLVYPISQHPGRICFPRR